MIIAYARVSTEEQNLDMQLNAFEKYGADNQEEMKIFSEKKSTRKTRHELTRALETLRSGDMFVIYKLDRLARSVRELHTIADDLQKRGINFVSISDRIDTSTAAGKAMFGMLAVFAEFERGMIQERTLAGLQSARKKGKFGGRPTIEEKTKKHIRTLYNAGESATAIAKEFGVGRSTVYKIVNEEQDAKLNK